MSILIDGALPNVRCPMCGRTVPSRMFSDGACDVWCRMVQPTDPLSPREVAPPAPTQAQERDGGDIALVRRRRE